MKCSRFIAALMVCVMVMGLGQPALAWYTFSQVRKDSPADFNSFLSDCNADELGALMKALRENGEATPEAISKAVVWRAYNKAIYMFRGDKEIDYHEIVQWAAEKLGVDSIHVKPHSTEVECFQPS